MANMMQEKATHTPGPWRVNGGASSVFQYDIVGPNGEDIAYANPSDGADEPTRYPVEANARLIAAAPELLEAAKHAAMEWRLHGQLTDSCRVLEAAIKKAEP